MDTQTLIKLLLKYSEQNPEQRFWQAIRNFTKNQYIWSSETLEGKPQDTFYTENKDVIKVDQELVTMYQKELVHKDYSFVDLHTAQALQDAGQLESAVVLIKGLNKRENI